MTPDLQLAAEYAATAVSEQRRSIVEQRGGGSEQREGSAGGDSPKVQTQQHQHKCPKYITQNANVAVKGVSCDSMGTTACGY